MAPLRTFVAVELGPAAREAAAGLLDALRARPGGERVRWVRPEGLHVTLRFLGALEPERVAIVTHLVGRETVALAPFEMRLGTVRPFPSPRRPRVVALALSPEDALAELAAAVERGVVAAGFPPEERGFRAHATLGRLRDGRFPEAGLPHPPPTPTAVREVVLFQSRLGPGGSHYLPLERIPLGGDASPHNQATRGDVR